MRKIFTTIGWQLLSLKSSIIDSLQGHRYTTVIAVIRYFNSWFNTHHSLIDTYIFHSVVDPDILHLSGSFIANDS